MSYHNKMYPSFIFKSKQSSVEDEKSSGAYLAFIKKELGKLPKVSGSLHGYQVTNNIPNLGSVASSLNEYEYVPGIREVPFILFEGDHSINKTYRSVSDIERATALKNKLLENRWIDPLVVVLDVDGFYILEGGHRFSSLYELGLKSFPAKVVVDTELLRYAEDEEDLILHLKTSKIKISKGSIDLYKLTKAVAKEFVPDLYDAWKDFSDTTTKVSEFDIDIYLHHYARMRFHKPAFNLYGLYHSQVLKDYKSDRLFKKTKILVLLEDNSTAHGRYIQGITDGKVEIFVGSLIRSFFLGKNPKYVTYQEFSRSFEKILQHELGHAADYIYQRSVKNQDKSYSNIKHLNPERFEYINDPTELKSWVYNVAQDILSGLPEEGVCKTYPDLCERDLKLYTNPSGSQFSRMLQQSKIFQQDVKPFLYHNNIKDFKLRVLKEVQRQTKYYWEELKDSEIFKHSSMNKIDFIQGACSDFAWALHKLYGYKPGAIFEGDYDGEEDEMYLGNMVHAFVYLPNGKVLDVNGVQSKQRLVSSLGDCGECIEVEFNNPQEFYESAFVDDGVVEEAIKFIQANESIFKKAALNTQDKKVIDAFFDKTSAEGKFWWTDGKSLYRHIPLAGQDKLAVWRGPKVAIVGGETTKQDDSAIRYMIRSGYKTLLTFSYDRGKGFERSLRFSHFGDVLGDQWNGSIEAYLPWEDEPVGTLDWVHWRGEYSISLIEVAPEYRRTGIATELYKELFRSEGISEKDLQPSMLTEDGAKFREHAKLSVLCNKCAAGLHDLGNVDQYAKTMADSIWDNLSKYFDRLEDLDHRPLSDEGYKILDRLTSYPSESEFRKYLGSINRDLKMGIGSKLSDRVHINLKKDSAQEIYDNTEFSLEFVPGNSRVIPSKVETLFDTIYKLKLVINLPTLIHNWAFKVGDYNFLLSECKRILRHEITHVIDLAYDFSRAVREEKLDYTQKPMEQSAWVENAYSYFKNYLLKKYNEIPRNYTWKQFEKDSIRGAIPPPIRQFLATQNNKDKKKFYTRLYKRLFNT